MHTCIHCGSDMELLNNWDSEDRQDVIYDYGCKCIHHKVCGGYVYGYTKYVYMKKIERLIIHWDRYTIITNYGKAFYKERQFTTVERSVVTIYDAGNGIQLTDAERTRVNSSIRPLSGIAWRKTLPPKDFSGMDMVAIKRWVSMLEHFQ